MGEALQSTVRLLAPAGRSPGLPDSTGTSLSGQSLALTFISSNLPESILPSLDIQLTKRRF